VDINTEDFRQHFGMLSDATLLKTNREDLVDAAKAILDQEIAHRRLNKTADAPAVDEDHPTEPAEETETAEAEPLVSVGSYTIVEEARLARGLLQIAGIPCGLQNEKSALGALHLMVPESHVGAALEVLGGEISEEELAAQAEAAGFEEEEFEEESK
jgi:hypothetical protein